MSTQLRGLLQRIVQLLDAANVPFMVAGSFASAAHGMPRTTQDLDMVIDPPGQRELDTFVRSMPAEQYYVDLDAARDALRLRSMFKSSTTIRAGSWTSSFGRTGLSAAKSSPDVWS
jgi:hypothetical protein